MSYLVTKLPEQPETIWRLDEHNIPKLGLKFPLIVSPFLYRTRLSLLKDSGGAQTFDGQAFPYNEDHHANSLTLLKAGATAWRQYNDYPNGPYTAGGDFFKTDVDLVTRLIDPRISFPDRYSGYFEAGEYAPKAPAVFVKHPGTSWNMIFDSPQMQIRGFAEGKIALSAFTLNPNKLKGVDFDLIAAIRVKGLLYQMTSKIIEKGGKAFELVGDGQANIDMYDAALASFCASIRENNRMFGAVQNIAMY